MYCCHLSFRGTILPAVSNIHVFQMYSCIESAFFFLLAYAKFYGAIKSCCVSFLVIFVLTKLQVWKIFFSIRVKVADDWMLRQQYYSRLRVVNLSSTCCFVSLGVPRDGDGVDMCFSVFWRPFSQFFLSVIWSVDIMFSLYLLSMYQQFMILVEYDEVAWTCSDCV